MTQAHSPSTTTEISLVAPVDGIIVPLEELVDPVFAEGMLGDGVSIDPTNSKVVAPCAGVITQLHRAKHAMTIRTEDGVSVLVHVGLDTVKLKGKGFKTLVKEGDRVSVRQHLLEFDLDLIARSALSAQVEVVVTEGGSQLSFKLKEGVVSAGEDEIARLEPDRGSSSPPARVEHQEQGERLLVKATIVNPHGMHARPAAQLAKVAKGYQAKTLLSFGELEVSATSVTDIMSLDLERGSEIQIRAQGKDAAQAIEAVRKAIATGLGEKLDGAAPKLALTRLTTDEEGVIGGVPASPGLAIGTLVVLTLPAPHFEAASSDSPKELALLKKGLKLTGEALAAEEESFKKAGETEKAQIFAAHAELLDDSALEEEVTRSIEEGASAAKAWQNAMDLRIEKLGSLKSQLLRQRASDMKDVGLRVLYAIVDKERPELELNADSILVCDDLSPSVAASFEAGSLGGIITELGGSTSHAAIIARSMGIPYVAGIASDIEKLAVGMLVIVDGSTGAIRIDPDDATLENAEVRIQELETIAKLQHKEAHRPAETLDGFRIEVAANIGNAADAELSTAKGCDGVGLLRSEFLFMNRRDPPSEEEQRREYEAIGKILGTERSLLIRTLDVGGDKPLSYMPLDEEENPFLGIRGLRVSLKYPEMFRSQIRAALSAAKHTKLNIMFPMVAQPDEFHRARNFVLEEMQKAGTTEDVSIGVMVEVPSAALNARWLAKEADFFSIGTNDLTQYTLAMDRGHSELAAQADAFDPAVLRLIQMTVEAAHAEGKWVGVCGGLAAEALAAPLLLGLGLDELSVPAPAIAELKAGIRSLNQVECQAVAEGALALPSAASVRALLQNFLDSTTRA